ncbi:Aminoacyl-histidine dipeptidase (Peptidase D) [Mucinivorans hirudinis]|uniref:Cytosol non-specific dipeptidase n=1 Tax=Mucinivorans hirudinis TaxID=1433126 RepID=A0A060R9W4_9BACT|nr:Aminoacyl-histidine dipeptidase (Peptidase D) [Mucinivorans hirudinis]
MKELNPQSVWRYFEEITRIPRPSKKEEKIRQYLRDFAKVNNLELREDTIGNIVIVRPAAVGCEQKEGVILQSHVDMVCEKEVGLDFDFETMPIETYIEDGWVRARGTTLGADCGIGMAMQMAVLTDPEIKTGKIEALFTVDEEQGLTGAFRLEAGMLTGSRMINLDSEDEGEVYIGCAGGIDTIAKFDVELKKAPSAEKYNFYKIAVGGLRGGHSGDDINKGLACANKILVRVLWAMLDVSAVKLCSIDGGNLRNAIARDAWAEVAISGEDCDSVILAASELATQIKAEYALTDPGVDITLVAIAPCQSRIDRESSRRLLMALQSLPHGVMAMSAAIPGLVETSTNLASVKMGKGFVEVVTSQRSSVESAKRDIARTVASVFELAGAKVRHTDGYPGWTPNPESPLVKLCEREYENLFARKIAVKAIHAGLECGLLLKKYPALDIISIGPTLRGVHSPAERLEVRTVDMVWQLLLRLI